MQDDFNSVTTEWFALEDGMRRAVPRGAASGIIAVRGSCPLPVLDTPAFRASEDTVAAALLILSQSMLARELAAVAIKAGYDLRITGANSESASAVAFCNTDPERRQINIGACGDAETLALHIIHELVHVSQMERGGLSVDTRLATPAASIRQLLAMEADARARTLQVAIELEFAGKGDPAERLLFPGIVMRAAAEAGVDKTQSLIADVMPQLPHEVTQDLLLAAVFRSFYSSAGLRRHYEGTVTAALATTGDDFSNEKLFTGGKSVEELRAALDSHMPPAYIAKYSDIIDLGSNFFAAISQKTQNQLDALQQEYRPVTEARWRLPVFDATLIKPKPFSGPQP